MSDIVLTAGVRANLLQLQSTAATITNTQSKLATGKRVKVHLLQAPTTCRKSWKFAQTNVLTGSGSLTATDSQPCTKR